MDVFYVRELIVILYIGHKLPFCKKCTISMMLNIYISWHFFINLIVYAFYVDEYMILHFKKYKFIVNDL